MRHILSGVRESGTFLQLATALEAGESVAFALRDALLEASQNDVADHFGGDDSHPWGCWGHGSDVGKGVAMRFLDK